jgi:intracellular multiplication protein IcmV
MGAVKIIKKSVAAGWSISTWIGTKQIKSNALLIKDLAKSAFSPSDQGAPVKAETFAQAMRRLGMTEADLQKRINASTKIIFFCGILIIPMLAYTVYIWMSHFYLSSFVCLMLTFLLSAYSFREHFNRFQMRQRRLGCTFSEWLAHTFRINLSRKK